LDEKVYSLNYIYAVRWLTSELIAIKKIKEMWFLIVTDLDLISKSQKFDSKAREMESNYRKTFLDKNFIVILHFIHI